MVEAYKERILRKIANGAKTGEIITTIQGRFGITVNEEEILNIIRRHPEYINKIIRLRKVQSKNKKLKNITAEIEKVTPYLEEMIIQRNLNGLGTSEFYFTVVQEGLIKMSLADFRLGLDRIEAMSDIIKLRDNKVYG